MLFRAFRHDGFELVDFFRSDFLSVALQISEHWVVADARSIELNLCKSGLAQRISEGRLVVDECVTPRSEEIVNHEYVT